MWFAVIDFSSFVLVVKQSVWFPLCNVLFILVVSWCLSTKDRACLSLISKLQTQTHYFVSASHSQPSARPNEALRRSDASCKVLCICAHCILRRVTRQLGLLLSLLSVLEESSVWIIYFLFPFLTGKLPVPLVRGGLFLLISSDFSFYYFLFRLVAPRSFLVLTHSFLIYFLIFLFRGSCR